MKIDRDILNQYDDALPERFSDIHRNDDAKKLHIHQGAGNPSPYIVKLSRNDGAVRPAMTVAEEIEATRFLGSHAEARTRIAAFLARSK